MRHTQALRCNISKEVKKILLKQSPGRKVASLLKPTYVHPPCLTLFGSVTKLLQRCLTCGHLRGGGDKTRSTPPQAPPPFTRDIDT